MAAENASWAHLSGHNGSDGVELSGAPGASSGSMQSVHSSSNQRSQAHLGTRCISSTYQYSIAVSRADAVTAAGRTTETQAALVAEGVLVKTGGDESRGVVAGGELEACA